MVKVYCRKIWFEHRGGVVLDIFLHLKERRVLSILNSSRGYVNSKTIAEKLRVSERTVRNYISHINDVLTPYQIQIGSLHGKGYLLECEHGKEYVIQKLALPSLNYQTRDDRVFHLLIRTVTSHSGLVLDSLEDEMFISRATLNEDIRQMSEDYEKARPNLKFIRRGNRLSAEQDEWKRRMALSKAFCNQLFENLNANPYVQDYYFGPRRLEEILNAIRELLDQYNYRIETRNQIELALYVSVAEIRIDAGFGLAEFDFGNIGSYAVQMSNALFNFLIPNLGGKFNSNERKYVAFYIQSLKSQLWRERDLSSPELSALPDVLLAADQIVGDIRDVFGVDFTADQKLKTDLCIQVMDCVSHMRFFWERDGSLYPMILNKFPSAVDLAVLAFKSLEERFGVAPSEAELGHFAAKICDALMRKMEQAAPNTKISAILISNWGINSNLFVRNQLNLIFESTLEVKVVITPYDIDRYIRTEKPQLILAAVNLKKDYIAGIPVIHLPCSLTHDFCSNIAAELIKIKERMVMPCPAIDWGLLFSEALFFRDVTVSSMEEAAQLLCSKLREMGYTEKSFDAAVQRREAIAPTIFYNGIATPHAVLPLAKKDAVAVAILRKPLFYRGSPIRCLLLPAFTPRRKNCLDTLWQRILSFHTDSAGLKRLLAARSLPEFLEAFEERKTYSWVL